MVAGSGEDNSAVVWSVPDGQKLCELHGHTEIGLHLALGNEPRVLVSTGTHMSSKTDHSVRLWSIPYGKPIAVLDDLPLPPHSVAVSHDGRFVAFAPDKGPLQLLELEVVEEVASSTQPVAKSAEPAFFKLTCPGCGKKLRVKAALAGKKARCPQCQRAVAVPPVQAGHPPNPQP